MKKTIIILILAIAFLMSSCGGNDNTPATGRDKDSEQVTENKPSTWIADRHIRGKVFIDDAGGAFPDDQIGNDVAQKIKELTGITLEWEYTSGDSDLEVMITSFAADDIPDVIASYLDNSGRPEFPVLLKAAREGMFVDLVPFMKDSKVYSKYMNPDYLPIDSYRNVFLRDEFGGKGYLLQMQVPRKPDSVLQADMAAKAGVDPAEITNTEEVLEAARKIKNAGITDAQGKPVIPIGPSVWGGRLEPSLYYSYAYSDGRESFFNVYQGKVRHITATPYMKKEIEVIQTGIREGLMDPEVLTMSNERAQEGFLNKHYAMMVMSTWQAVDKYYKTSAKYIPLIHVENLQGNTEYYVQNKSPWCVWAVSSKAENPEEIVKFADFLASKEGKLIWQYGIEGKTYDLDEDGMPVIKKELLELQSEDPQAARQLNLGALGGWWGRPLGWTDLAQYEDFGEYNFGDKHEPEKVDLTNETLAYFTPHITYYDGLPAASYLNEMPAEFQSNLKQFIEPQYYTDIFTQACFAQSPEETKKLLDDYRALLEKQGIGEFEEYLQGIYKETPNLIHFH